MTDSIEFDLIIAGSGLAGLRAAIEAAKKNQKIKIGVIAKTQVMRSHSVSAEGGTAAVIQEDKGDTIESHIYDTVKGSDFLADQDTAEKLCHMMPNEIFQLEHWGMPWSRQENGKIDQRNFGGYSFPRATYAIDKVGFFEMQTLYDTCQKLIDTGVTINRPPREGRMAFVKSPDNISIELLQQGENLEIKEPWSSMKNVGTW